MRKYLEAICLTAFIFQLWITVDALAGPHHLPVRIPIHFDASGHVNGWGSPNGLAVLPVFALGIYALFTFLSNLPDLFNYPVQATEENRSRLQGLTVRMMLWMKAEIVCLFTWISWMMIQAARLADGKMSPHSIYGLVTMGFVGLLLATVTFSMVSMFRAR
jgi:uncharacterized membrane protein